MVECIPTNCEAIDSLLGDGVRTGTITQIYGPAASGKTNICLQTLVNCVKMGKKAVFIDTEGSFSEKRLEQIAGEAKRKVMESTYLLEPANFAEQAEMIATLEEKLDKSVALIIIDSMVTHYRLELNKDDSWGINKELGKQMAKLMDIARKRGIAVLVTNQVYADPGRQSIEPIGGDVLRYSSKIILELEKRGHERIARIVKHQFKKDSMEGIFRITGKGIV